MIKTTTKKYEDINRGKYLDRSSFLRLLPILDDNGEHVYNIFRPYVPNEAIFNDRNFDYTTLSNGEWWENIAYDYYANENLWWVLCVTNKVVNPFEEINEGDIVYELKSNFLNILYTDVEKVRNL
jgi:hypothetical protein